MVNRIKAEEDARRRQREVERETTEKQNAIEGEIERALKAVLEPRRAGGGG